MALTAIAVARNTLNDAGFSTGSLQIPRILSAVAITTADALGVALTNLGSQGPAALVSLSAAADWFWNSADSVATTSSRKILAGDSYMLQLQPGQTINLYCKTGSTTNLIVTHEG